MALFSKLPNTCYRVSLKAVIKNAAGHVLVVKEQSDSWSLPGGGLDHGESVYDALARELTEEVNAVARFRYKPLGMEPIYVASKQAWLLWVVYCIEFTDAVQFSVGEHATEVRFIDPRLLKKSKTRSERLVYKWSQMPIGSQSSKEAWSY